MAECKKLEVKFVDGGVRETICTAYIERFPLLRKVIQTVTTTRKNQT